MEGYVRKGWGENKSDPERKRGLLPVIDRAEVLGDKG